MADGSFTAQVDAIVRKTDKRMNALVRESTQRVIDFAQTPVAKGGRMRVDTGFLRASGRLSTNGMPSGPSRNPGMGPFKPEVITLKIATLKIGDTIFFGWTAAYAKYREAKDGFLITAVQRWPEIVRDVTAEIKRRIK